MRMNENYDRKSTNEDGHIFYGYDHDDGRTVWYDERGDVDCITETPDEFEYEPEYW